MVLFLSLLSRLLSVFIKEKGKKKVEKTRKQTSKKRTQKTAMAMNERFSTHPNSKTLFRVLIYETLANFWCFSSSVFPFSCGKQY